MAKRQRNAYTADQKAEALALYATDGPTEVAAQLGIPASTVVSWAKAAGVRTMRNEKMAAANDAAKLTLEQRKLTLAERLQVVAEKATEREIALIGSSKLRDVVGARTRAVHDVALLTGGPTNRTEHVTVDAVDAEIARLTAELELSVGPT